MEGERSIDSVWVYTSQRGGVRKGGIESKRAYSIRIRPFFCSIDIKTGFDERGSDDRNNILHKTIRISMS